MTKPYYQDKFCTIYHGDCLEIMPELEPVDLVLTDPPYSSDLICKLLKGDNQKFQSICFFGYPEELVKWCLKLNLIPNEWITWFPTNAKSMGLTPLLPKESEHIAIFGKIYTSKHIRRKRGEIDSWQKKVLKSRGSSLIWSRDGDVWRDPSPHVGVNAQGKRLHVNQKPVSIFLKLIGMLLQDKAIIADPFMGSGTTLVAAKQLRCKAIGIEIEEKYCDIAVRRLAQEVIEFDKAI